MYLPGFHECQLNSAWWGQGATEWDSVRSATPLAANHRQPRTPTWGFYDLSNPRVIAKQAALAKEFGIDGFCIYHYWSLGKRPLRKPLEVILDNPDLDVKFCLCWANHPWFTTWKGYSKKPRRLMAQLYEADKAQRQLHIDFLIRALSDDRAMRISDRPVISIFDPSPISIMTDFIDHLRSEALRRLRLDIFCSAWVTPQQAVTSTELLTLFDSLILSAGSGLQKQRELNFFEGSWRDLDWLARRFPETLKTDSLRFLYWQLKSKSSRPVKKLDSDEFWKNYLSEYEALSSLNYSNIDAQLLVGWDNTPRLGSFGSYFANFDIDKLSKYTDQLVSLVTKRNPGGLIYIYAWNEWGEGAYLEPDTHSGTASLQAISEALKRNRRSQ